LIRYGAFFRNNQQDILNNNLAGRMQPFTIGYSCRKLGRAKMKSFLVVSFLVFLMPAFALGQDQNNAAQGYAFVGLGDSFGTTALHFGGGGEFDLYKGLGLSLDLGYMAPSRGLQEGIGIFSPNGRYAFRHSADSKLIPYITAGYSLLFRRDTANAFNYGGGVDYWFAEKVGLKVEFRDHVLTQCRDHCHAYQIRGGFSFR
jgi:hypothetical protein